MFFHRFESGVALLGEGDGERSQASSRELGWGGLRGLQLGAQQLLCYLPQRKKLTELYKCTRRSYLGSEREETFPLGLMHC